MGTRQVCRTEIGRGVMGSFSSEGSSVLSHFLVYRKETLFYPYSFKNLAVGLFWKLVSLRERSQRLQCFQLDFPVVMIVPSYVTSDRLPSRGCSALSLQRRGHSDRGQLCLHGGGTKPLSHPRGAIIVGGGLFLLSEGFMFSCFILTETEGAMRAWL